MSDKTMRWLVIVLGILVIVVGSMIFVTRSYNKMVEREAIVEEEFSNVDVNLKARADKIPNLVNVTQAHINLDKDIINSITSARSALKNAGTVQEKMDANNALNSALSRLLMVIENYPELKANETIVRLFDEIAGAENRIAVSRRNYNNAVKDYNVYIKKFPNNFIANSFDFNEKDYFEIDEASRKTPEVNLK